MHTAPRAMSGRGGGADTGTAVVAGLVRLLTARGGNDARSKSVGVETKKFRQGTETKRGAKVPPYNPLTDTPYGLYATTASRRMIKYRRCRAARRLQLKQNQSKLTMVQAPNTRYINDILGNQHVNTNTMRRISYIYIYVWVLSRSA